MVQAKVCRNTCLLNFVQEYLQTLVYMTTGVLKRPPLENCVHVKVFFLCVCRFVWFVN